MIKINLLPFRAARQKENIRRQVSIFFLLVLLSFAGLYFVTININKKINDINEKNTSIKKEIALYKAKSDKVEKIKKDLATLEDKLKIVARLQEERKKPVELLDGMTQFIIPERMWLTSMKATDTGVSVKGIAYDNPTIADFMKKLENSSIFQNINLNNSKIKKIREGINLKEFDLVCIPAKPKTPEVPNNPK